MGRLETPAFFSKNVIVMDSYLGQTDVSVVSRHVKSPHEFFNTEPRRIDRDNKASYAVPLSWVA